MDILSDKELLSSMIEMIDSALQAFVRSKNFISMDNYYQLVVQIPKVLCVSEDDSAKFPHLVAARAAFLGFGSKFDYSPGREELPTVLLEPFVINNFIVVTSLFVSEDNFHQYLNG